MYLSLFLTALFPFLSAECSEADEGTAALHDQTGMEWATTAKKPADDVLVMPIAPFQIHK